MKTLWHTKCEDTRTRLDEYVAATLPEADATRVRTHIESCARCAHAAALRTALRRSLSSSSVEIELPSGFRQSLLDRLATASAEPTRAPLRRSLPQPGLVERLGEWWDRTRWAVAARPVATLAVSVVAVVLAIMAAQVVGTRHDPSGVAFPSLENGSVALETPTHPEGTSDANGASGSLPPAQPGTGNAEDVAPLPSTPASEECSVSTPASFTLAAVSPDIRSVVSSDGIDVVAAFDGYAIDPRSARVTMRVDDIDVTGSARVTPEFVAYTPATRLAAGTHVVSVDVADHSGARRTLSWEFYVLES